MTPEQPNIVIAGDKIFAGIDEDDRSEIENAIVIQFPDKKSMGRALLSKSIKFTVFEDPDG